MRSGLIAIIFVTLFSAAASAQSGRRLPGAPTPTPPGAQNSNRKFSESKPRSGRDTRYSDRFPGISTGIRRPQAAPTPAGAAAVPADDGDTLKVSTDLITIPVSVFDDHGLYISGLKQQDFAIFEDGQEQDIAYFATSDKPVTVALLIDTSPSTQYRIEEIHEAAMAFVDLLRPDDSVIVIEFHSSVKVQTRLTKDRELIRKGIYKAKFGNGTSLYNAVDEALRKQLERVPGRKAVVLFTDGVDTTSRKNSYDSTLKYAQESDSMVFPIYYNTYLENRARNQPVFFPDDLIFAPPQISGVSAEEYALGRRYLDELSDATGGRVFRPERVPGGLTAAFRGIAEELRRQYSIGYVPKEEGRRGQRKSIKVRVYRPDVNVRARDSYVVGAPTSRPAAEPVKSN